MEVEIKEFAYNNPKGGTNLSHGNYHPRFSGKGTVKLKSGFWDYETGWRYRGEAVSEDLKSFISEHGHPVENTVYFSEFDLVDASLREIVAEEALKIEREEFNSYLMRLKESIVAQIMAQSGSVAARFDGSVAVLFSGNVFFCSLCCDGIPEYQSLVEPDISAWNSEWKKELDAWFTAPQFVSYSDEDHQTILSNFI